jgi:Domain of unknown function (DUF6966)
VNRSVQHHLAAHGGMGSLGDVYLTSRNGHKVSSLEEPWLNSLLDLLRSSSAMAAKSAKLPDFIVARVVKQELGRFQPRLRGGACPGCQYTQVDPAAIERFVADETLKALVMRDLKNDQLVALVDRAVAGEVRELALAQAQISAARDELRGRGVIVGTQEIDWSKECPKCGSAFPHVVYWVRKDGRLEKVPPK